MVMELPTPQCVGREFVRQYYTLLNKAPLHLHRFYNHDSSFLHGGLDRPGQETRPVVGQQDIHERIMQLNFRDCHAKIRQVDSQETLGDGVVVQVSGELSNNGQPMRRFMQTFVLVPQSPKKYYVRNDIFRYQDEIFSDDDNGDLDSALADLDVEEDATNKTAGSLVQDDDVGYHENEIVRNGSVYSSDSVVVNKYGTHGLSGTQPPREDRVTDSIVVNKYGAHNLSGTQPPREDRVSPQPECEVESTKSDWEDEEEEEEEEDEEEDLEEEEITSERVAEDLVQETMESTPVVSQEPKTYANMVSKNTSSTISSGHPATSNATSPVSNLPASHKTVEQPPSYHKNETTPITTGQQAGSGFNQQGNRMSRPRLNSGRGGSARFENTCHDLPARSPEDSEADKRKANFIHYPDAQQLFVGNLTHSITEEDLKSHFTQFGKVLDMRINTKQPLKTGGGKVPNFGFIVFEDAESVQKVLGSRPIYFNDHRLNVEEKKRPKDNRMMSGDNRVGPPRGGASPRVGVGGRGPRGGMMSQGSGRGDRGGMRGGYTPRR